MSLLLQLHPNDFMNLGESWKGVFCPFPPICHPEEQSDEGSRLLMEEGIALLQLHPKRILSLSRGKFEGGLFTPSIE